MSPSDRLINMFAYELSSNPTPLLTPRFSPWPGRKRRMPGYTAARVVLLDLSEMRRGVSPKGGLGDKRSQLDPVLEASLPEYFRRIETFAVHSSYPHASPT